MVTENGWIHYTKKVPLDWESKAEYTQEICMTGGGLEPHTKSQGGIQTSNHDCVRQLCHPGIHDSLYIYFFVGFRFAQSGLTF